jgi:DNA polymerase V
MVMDLVPEAQVQAGIFDSRGRAGANRLMQTVDQVNRAFGQDLVRLAVQGFNKRYTLRQSRLSPRYTTRIGEIIKVFH